MKRVTSIVAVILATCAFGSIGLGAYAAQSEQIMAAADGVPDSAGLGSKTCGANCSDGFFEVGTCFNTQTCCGWVKCSSSGNSGR